MRLSVLAKFGQLVGIVMIDEGIEELSAKLLR